MELFTPQEKLVRELRTEIISKTRTYAYSLIGSSGEKYTRKVREKAYKLGQRMSDIPDKNLHLVYKILKYEYATIAFTLASSVELDSKKKNIICE